MTKAKKASVLIFNRKNRISRRVPIVLTTATGEDVSGDTSGRIRTAIAISPGGAINSGDAYIYINTAGTGTVITD